MSASTPAVGPKTLRSVASVGEEVVACPRPDCTWRTVRPAGRAAESAARAHAIAHRKHMVSRTYWQAPQ